MAALYQRANGYYYAQFFDASKQPQRRQIALRTSIKRQAEKRLRELAFPRTERSKEASHEIYLIRTTQD